MSWFRSYESLYPKGERGWRSPLHRARKAVEEALKEKIKEEE